VQSYLRIYRLNGAKLEEIWRDFGVQRIEGRGQKKENSDYVFVDEYDFTIIKIKICLT
jgi:hypothetical protein